MKALVYHTVGAASAAELDKAVNALLEEGYQLYGSPYLSEQPVEGLGGSMAFYQAVTAERETGDKKAALMKTLAEGIEIKELKMTK